MPRAIKFDEFGGADVLRVVEVEQPVPGAGEVLVRVKANGINPVESGIRGGYLQAVYPTTFPAGQGNDLAGIVVELGAGAEGVSIGDEVIGFTTNRTSQADFAVVPAAHLTRRPAGVSWEAAGALYTVGAAAFAALRAIAVGPGDTLVIAGAAGGVGSVAVQLAKNSGATVIGLASESHHDWLVEHGATPVAYGEGVADRINEAAGGKVDAFLDAFGADYVELAIQLGVQPQRINTLINFAAVGKHGVKAAGNNDASSAEVLAELAGLIVKGVLEIPIAATYSFDDVQDAYRQLEQRRTLGKIVLLP